MPNQMVEKRLGLRPIDEAYNSTDFSTSYVDRDQVINFLDQFKRIQFEIAENIGFPSCNSISEKDAVIQKSLCQLSDPDYGIKRILIQEKPER